MGHSRRQVLLGAATAYAASILPHPARAQDAVRIAISFSDIPRLWGGPDGGFSGMRFAGYPVFDALINWDLEHEDRPSGIIPGLATEWAVDFVNHARWIVKLRQGVTFHDGAPFDADAAVWNFASVFDDKAPQFNALRAAMIRPRLPSITGAEKIDDHTIAVLTSGPDALAAYQLSFLLHVSPAQFARLDNNWDRFAAAPSGTGPFRVTALVPRTRLDLARNEAYWDKARVPKAAAITLLPIQDPNARVAALRAGQVDMVEAAPSDALDSLKGAGFTVHSNVYPGVMKWSLSFLPDSPFHDLRVRQAANLAIDRAGLVTLLNGNAIAAKGFVPDSSPWFGKPQFHLRYDPDAAKRLLAEAGFNARNRVKARIMISTAGGGQADPGPVNEFLQANLAAVGIDVEFQVVERVALFSAAQRGAKAPTSAGINGMYIEGPTLDPTSFFLVGYESDLTPPRGSNWGYYNNTRVDDALRAAKQAFDPAALDAAMAEVNQLMVDDAAALILAHALSPWAMTSRVRDFIEPRNWFINLTSLSMT